VKPHRRYSLQLAALAAFVFWNESGNARRSPPFHLRRAPGWRGLHKLLQNIIRFYIHFQAVPRHRDPSCCRNCTKLSDDNFYDAGDIFAPMKVGLWTENNIKNIVIFILPMVNGGRMTLGHNPSGAWSMRTACLLPWLPRSLPLGPLPHRTAC